MWGKHRGLVSAWLQPEPTNWWPIVDDALAEDLGSGDITAGCLDVDLVFSWKIEAQADGYLSGAGIADYLLGPMPGDPDSCWIESRRNDGERVKRGDTILEGRTNARRVLMCERTALNFLMHMSGIATLTNLYVQKVEDTEARIVDTRKTLPMLRPLQKYAVRCGGGHNHRMGLYDGVLIKDNHIAAVGSITEAVKRVRSYVSHMVKVEVECENLEQVEESVKAGAEVVLLDNMDPFTMREAVNKYRGKCVLEASGGVGLDTVRAIAQTGVDLVSVGALTHSAVSLPFHMEAS
jgi:nicotinate-nucleotide pyrophosphorylase (carboxylating)